MDFKFYPKTGDEQHISLPNDLHQQAKLTGGQTQGAYCKAREERIPVIANKVVGVVLVHMCRMWKEVGNYQGPEKVGGQAMVSIVWLQGSLLLVNLVLLFTSLVLTHILSQLISVSTSLVLTFILKPFDICFKGDPPGLVSASSATPCCLG